MNYSHPILMETSITQSQRSSISCPISIGDFTMDGPHPMYYNTLTDNTFEPVASPPQEEEEDGLILLDYTLPNVLWMLIAAILGLVTGALLNRVKMDPILQKWIGEIGVLYVNVMECLALPLIFTTVTICIAHLVRASKTASVMSRMLFMFFVSTLLSACMAMMVSFAMSFTFKPHVVASLQTPSSTISIALQCPNHKYLSMNGSLCTEKRLKDAFPLYATNITGITTTMEKMEEDNSPRRDITYVQQISNFLLIIFQENVTDAFATGSFLGIIIFAMLIGKGLVCSQENVAKSQRNGRNYGFVLFTQLEVVLELILNWLLPWIPLGTVSSMTFSIMTGNMSESHIQQSMYLPITLLITLMLYFVTVVCSVYYILLRKNPLQFVWHLIPALVFLFATGNHLATVPVLMRSMVGSKEISKTLSQYAVSLGTAISLCGNAAYFVVSCVFMAYTSGLESQLTAGRVLLLILSSTFSSFGTPQTLNMPTTYVATIWLTVFSSTVPDSFAYVVMLEWLMARMRRVQNIIVVAFMARVIADQVDETVEDEADRGYHSAWGGEQRNYNQ